MKKDKKKNKKKLCYALLPCIRIIKLKIDLNIFYYDLS